MTTAILRLLLIFFISMSFSPPTREGAIQRADYRFVGNLSAAVPFRARVRVGMRNQIIYII